MPPRTIDSYLLPIPPLLGITDIKRAENQAEKKCSDNRGIYR